MKALIFLEQEKQQVMQQKQNPGLEARMPTNPGLLYFILSRKS